MKTIKRIPLDEIKNYVRYDSKEDLLIRIKGGKPISTTESDNGYLYISIKNKKYLLHRTVYAIAHNKEVFGIIDHIDGDKKNCKLSNLRELENGVNIFWGRKSHGSKGIYYNNSTNFWEAYINYRKRIYLGIFREKEDAISARLAAEKKYYH